MTIWGKLAGAAAGFALGGPLGALLGGVAGHIADTALDSGSETGPQSGPQFGNDAGQPERSQVVFTMGVIALSAKMAKADGRVTSDEVEAFNQVFHIPPEEAGNVRRIFNLAKRDVAGYESYARQIANIFRNNPGALEDLLDGLFYIAKADAELHPMEIDFLRRVSDIFGFSPREFERLHSSHALGIDGELRDDPYLILGIDPDISNDDLKKAYRRMVKENHPDALSARGVPEEFVTLANEKLAAINVAYERILLERGLTVSREERTTEERNTEERQSQGKRTA